MYAFQNINKYVCIRCGLFISFEYVELMLLTFLLPEIKEAWDLTESTTGMIGNAILK